MLQTSGSDGKIQGFLMVWEREPTVNQSRGKSVAGADAVDDMRDLIPAARDEFLSVIQTGGPAIL